MRVLEWNGVNDRSLVAVIPSEKTVRLEYQHNPEHFELTQELERLVKSENGCCGAAGVEFELSGMSVVVKIVREGLPAQTVIAAFSAMSPS